MRPAEIFNLIDLQQKQHESMKLKGKYTFLLSTVNLHTCWRVKKEKKSNPHWCPNHLCSEIQEPEGKSGATLKVVATTADWHQRTNACSESPNDAVRFVVSFLSRLHMCGLKAGWQKLFKIHIVSFLRTKSTRVMKVILTLIRHSYLLLFPQCIENQHIAKYFILQFIYPILPSTLGPTGSHPIFLCDL